MKGRSNCSLSTRHEVALAKQQRRFKHIIYTSHLHLVKRILNHHVPSQPEMYGNRNTISHCRLVKERLHGCRLAFLDDFQGTLTGKRIALAPCPTLGVGQLEITQLQSLDAPGTWKDICG